MSNTRLPLQDRSNLQSNLQIRVVPYSPPRLSSDFSAHLDIDTCSPGSGTSPANVEVYQSDTPQTQRLPADNSPAFSSPAFSSPAFSGPASPLGVYTRPSDQETTRRRASTPRRPSTSSSSRRLRHVINVHADKTFSLRPQVEYESSSVYSSSFLNSTVTNSTYGRNSSAAFSHGRRSSTLPLQQQDSAPTSPDEKTPPPQPSAKDIASTSSPWNYEFIGGLRKVHQQTPASDFKAELSPVTTPSRAHLPGPETGIAVARQSLMLIPRKPLPSSYTESAVDSDTPNYRVIKQTLPKPAVHCQPSLEFINFTPSSDQNYRIVGDSGSSDYSLGSQSRPRTEDSEPNYVKLEGAPSPSVAATPASRLKSEFSRESLIVAPLNPARKLFTDKPVSIKLPQGGSSPRFLATWSAMMNHDAARALFGSRIYTPRSRSTRAPSQSGSSSTTPRAHQFQSQPPLSTVFSESEGETERLSRSMSPFAAESSNSRISPDLSADDFEPGEYSFTRQVTPTSEPVDWPQAAFGKGKEREPNSSYRLVGDQDEYGDGLTDLRDLLTHRPSRRGGFTSMITNYASDRNLRSSASARATNWAVPAWARQVFTKTILEGQS